MRSSNNITTAQPYVPGRAILSAPHILNNLILIAMYEKEAVFSSLHK